MSEQHTACIAVHAWPPSPPRAPASTAHWALRFVEIDPPADAEVEAITRKVAIRVLRLFQSLDDTGDGAASSEPLLENLVPPESSPRSAEAIEIKKSPRCALLGGFSVHANVSICADKKDAVERLCRYIMRPPVALSRLAQLSDRGEMLERILRRPVLNWSELLRRVFAIDILACPCGGRRKVIAFITNPNVARKILDHIGLPSAPSQAVSARAPPQIDSDEFSGPILPG